LEKDELKALIKKLKSEKPDIYRHIIALIKAVLRLS